MQQTLGDTLAWPARYLPNKEALVAWEGGERRAWTYARPGYAGKEAQCFLKKEIKPPRRKAGFTSGVVR